MQLPDTQFAHPGQGGLQGRMSKAPTAGWDNHERDHCGLDARRQRVSRFGLSRAVTDRRTGIVTGSRAGSPGFGLTALLAAGTLLVVSLNGTAQTAPPIHATYDAATGRATIAEAGKPVLGYIYQPNPVPDGFFDGLQGEQEAYARRYAIPRGNYIHPLHGPDGSKLTADWNKDHPHHRGIYWAWPEVRFGGETGDLHALQRVWARPTGKLATRNGERWAEIEAENRWMWEDKTPVVRELATIRAWQAGPHGRHIDLTFRFEALADGVTLARRDSQHYGGLNIRLAPVEPLRLLHHADAEGASPRMAWHTAAGRWPDAAGPAAMTVFEHAANSGYPADHIEYPELPWFQPTFPRAGVRHALEQGAPLTLRYRIWINPGPAPAEEDLRGQWSLYQSANRS